MSTDDLPGPGRAPDLARLRSLEPESCRRGRNLSKATVSFYRIDDAGVVLKSYEKAPLVARQLLGRWLIRREVAAFTAVTGASGLPRFLGRMGPFALATEWIEARPLSELEQAEPEVFDHLARVVDELHGRGLALVDLHHRDVLVTANGSVVLVDLATAWVLGSRPGWLRRRLFVLFCDLDRIAMARMRARFAGSDPDKAVAEVGGRAAAWYRLGRRVKAAWDRLRGLGKKPASKQSSSN